MTSALGLQCLRTILCLMLLVATSDIQAAETKSAFDLPRDARFWINSSPFSLQQCRGKAVFLYFFEAECPRCAEGADDPIVFLAVSPGTSRQQMERYVDKNNVRWGLVLDPDRRLETAMDVGTISLMNIAQVVTIDPAGQPQQGSWRDMEASVKESLQDAKWTIDPKSITTALRPTWQQIEFENFAAAAPALNKALKSPKGDLKSSAQALMEVVQGQIDELAKTGDTAYESGDKWSAFRSYTVLGERFKGYSLPPKVESRTKELRTDPSVKAELAAFQTLEKAKRLATDPKQAKNAIQLLKLLAKNHAETEAGREAAALLGTSKAD
jgi:peroxiredoxin